MTILMALMVVMGPLLLLRGGAYFGIRSTLSSTGWLMSSHRGMVTGLGVLFVILGLATFFVARRLRAGMGWAWSWH